MRPIPDDPIVASIQRTGYPYWMSDEPEEEPEDEFEAWRFTERDKWGNGRVYCYRDYDSILERLAQYEDLGKTPDQLFNLLEATGG